MSSVHRELNFRRFVTAVPPDLLERYFSGLAVENVPSGWAALNGDELERFLSLPENDGLNAIIRRDLQRINDLCGRGETILVQAYEKFGLEYDSRRSSEDQAVRLFLDYEDAWGFAWSRYLLYALGGHVYTYFMPAGKLDPSTEALEAFTSELKGAFNKQGKGDNCRVQTYEDHGQDVVYVERGWFMKAYSHWQGETIAVESYRPALDDVLAYDAASSDLLVKAPHDSDRQSYVRAFAKCIVGRPELAEDALNHVTYDLSPIQEGSFSYLGDDQISHIDLVGIRLQLPAGRFARLEIHSPDVHRTLETIPGLTLKSGKLVSARLSFRFYVKKGREPRVTFDVVPPARTDLPDTRFSGLINDYLRREKIKLR